MKQKKRLSASLLTAVLTLALTGCSDYDNGYTEQQITFKEGFKAKFGHIDPEQDWNMAERGFVTVSTAAKSEVKIYVLQGQQYCLVGDYTDVIGTRTLGFDMAEGTDLILVTDGHTAHRVKPGDTVSFAVNAGTRTTHEGDDGTVRVTKIDDEQGITIGNVTYPKYKYVEETELNKILGVVPEIGSRNKNRTNLNNVTHDFSYVSNGAFIIYPVYWHTSSVNTIGVYYDDATGQRREVDVYTIQESNDGEESELLYWNTWTEESETVIPNATSGWYITAQGRNADRQDNVQLQDNPSLTKGFQYWYPASGTNELRGKVEKTFSGLANGTYRVEVDAFVYSGRGYVLTASNQNNKGDGQYVKFYANGKSTSLRKPLVSDFDHTAQGYTNRYSMLYTQQDNQGHSKLYNECQVTDGTLTVGFEFLDGLHANWFVFDNLRIVRMETKSGYASTDGKASFNTSRVRGQGIKVDIPAGTKFGMYLRKTDTTTGQTYTFYSESQYNNPAICGEGVTDDGLRQENSVREVAGMNPCFASTFYVDGLPQQMFLGFEDWQNNAKDSDFDLNDVVLAFSGDIPVIINEDPQPAASWMLACEDLGGTFDIDYNDVVFKVTHVSGQTTATLTPLAAGGTLASYIFFQDPLGTGHRDKCFGEIHHLLGKSPTESGKCPVLNAGYSRGQEGTPITFDVAADWTLAYYTSNTWGQSSQYSHANMGGFEIRTLPKGAKILENDEVSLTNESLFTGASRIPAPDLGEAPYIICLPYSYVTANAPTPGQQTTTVWAWPQECCSITNQYPDFITWVADKTQAEEWYKHPVEDAMTVEEQKVVTQMYED